MNLTQRTKSFLRSNFVSPPPSSSIKCLNNQHQKVELAKGFVGSNANKLPADNNVVCNNGTNGISENKCDRIGARAGVKLAANNKSNGYERSQLSTFGNANLSRAQLDCESDPMDKITAASNNNNSDIRTLNTRVAKPSYLKSLISSSSGTKRQNSSSNTTLTATNSNGNNCEACSDHTATCTTLAHQHPNSSTKYSDPLAGCEPVEISERTHSRPNPMGSKTIRLGQSQKLASVGVKARNNLQTIRSIEQNCDRYVEN